MMISDRFTSNLQDLGRVEVIARLALLVYSGVTMKPFKWLSVSVHDDMVALFMLKRRAS